MVNGTRFGTETARSETYEHVQYFVGGGGGWVHGQRGRQGGIVGRLGRWVGWWIGRASASGMDGQASKRGRGDGAFDLAMVWGCLK